MSGLLAIVNASEGDFNKLANAIDNSTGAADKMAKIRMDNFAGDLEYLSGDFDALKMDIMSSKIGNLRSIVQGADKVLGDFAASVKEHGLGVRSIFDAITSAVMRLVNEVKELNGSGSVLAALTLGAGAFGAYKLGKKGMGLFKSNVPDMGGNDGGSDTVGDMTVNALNVTLNAAKLLPGTGAPVGKTSTPVPEAVGPTARVGKMAKIGKYAKWGGRVAGALAVASSIYNVATADDKDKVQVAGQEGSGLLGMAAGAKAGAMAGGAIGAAFGGVGAAPGAAIGGLIGGAAGYFGGTELGKMIDWDGVLASGKEAIDGIKSMWDSGIATLGEVWDSVVLVAQDAWECLVTGAKSVVMRIVKPFVDTFNTMVGVGAMVWDYIEPYWTAAVSWLDTTVWQPIKTVSTDAWNRVVALASEAWEGVTALWDGAMSWFDSVVWQPIKAFAMDTWNGVVALASEAWGGVTALWNVASSWFDSVVWEPIKSAVAFVGDSIITAFTGAIDTVKGAWSGVVGWFQENIIGPLTSAFTSLGQKANEARARGEAVTGVTVPQHAVGSSHFSGGWTEINERGGEIVDLPNGSRIYPHATTERMLKQELGSSNGGSANVNISGNTFVVREEADIDRIAHQIMQLFTQAQSNYGGGY